MTVFILDAIQAVQGAMQELAHCATAVAAQCGAVVMIAVYVGMQAHSSIAKACMIAGVQHVRLVETSGEPASDSPAEECMHSATDCSFLR